MFNASFVASVMNMKADIYVQQNGQDPNTGAVTRQWVYKKTVQCKVEPIAVGGASTKGDNRTYATNAEGAYTERMQLKFKGLELMSKRWRIENIRSNDGQKVYIEVDKIDQPDTKFEVTASHAVLDPFGKISYYETIVTRVQVQDDDSTAN